MHQPAHAAHQRRWKGRRGPPLAFWHDLATLGARAPRRRGRSRRRSAPSTPGRTRCCGPASTPTCRSTPRWRWPSASGLPPREVAQRLVEHLDLGDVCSERRDQRPRLREPHPAPTPGSAPRRPGSGRTTGSVSPARSTQRVVIDYSAPNVAKEMHVGHLRTTVVGDALARTLEHLGHDVVRQNHIGDWGTPFGMLIEHLLDVGEDSDEARLVETDPNAFYQAARERFDGDEAFATRARRRVVVAPGRRRGDAPALGRAGRALPALLQPHLRPARCHPDRRGPGRRVDVQRPAGRDLRRARGGRDRDRSARARCASSSTATPAARGSPVPLIIRKSDGGYGYATTDLATIRYRIERPARRPHPLRHRRAAGAAPADGLGHRPQGRLAARRGRPGARPDRQRPRRGPQDPAHPVRRSPAADGAARRGGRAPRER